MRFTLHQLEAFVWTARLGTVHAAAKHLNLTQPAVSNRIKELEQDLSLPLFQRHNQRLQVTPEGRNALVYAERVLASAQDMARLDQGSTLSGLIRIGVDESCAIVGMPQILKELKDGYPSLRVDLTVGGGAELLRRIDKGELDVALHTGQSEQPSVASRFIGWTEHQWLAAPELVLPPGPFLPEHALACRIVSNPPPSTLNSSVTKWLRAGGFEFEEYSRCNSLSLMLSLVLSGHAIAVLPVSIARAHVELADLRVLDAQPALPAVPYYFSYLAQHRVETAARILTIAQRNLVRARFFAQDLPPPGVNG